MSNLFAGLAASPPPTTTGNVPKPELRGQPPTANGPSFREALQAAQEQGWPAESEAPTDIPAEQALTEAELAALAALLPATATLPLILTAETAPIEAGTVGGEVLPAPLLDAPALATTQATTEHAVIAPTQGQQTLESAEAEFVLPEATPALAPTFTPLSTPPALAHNTANASPDEFAVDAKAATEQPVLQRAATTNDPPPFGLTAAVTQNAPPVTVALSESARLSETRATDLLPQVQRGVTSLVQSGQTALKLQLHPEHLGRLDVQLTTGAEGVRVSIVADQSHAGRLLENHIADLRQTLTDAGLTIAGLSVSLNMGNGQTFNMANWRAPHWPHGVPAPLLETETAPVEGDMARRAARLDLGHQVDYSI